MVYICVVSHESRQTRRHTQLICERMWCRLGITYFVRSFVLVVVVLCYDLLALFKFFCAQMSSLQVDDNEVVEDVDIVDGVARSNRKSYIYC